MARHFLLSAAARSLSLVAIARMTDDQAHAAFIAIRWAANDGQPFCPNCGCLTVYTYTARRIYRCKGCKVQFSVTSGTLFASRKLPIRDYLLAIALFTADAKGVSATEPLTTRDIALEMLVSRALDKNDQRLLRLMTKRVGVALRDKRDAGLVKSDQGPGQFQLWEIAR